MEDRLKEYMKDAEVRINDIIVELKGKFRPLDVDFKITVDQVLTGKDKITSYKITLRGYGDIK